MSKTIPFTGSKIISFKISSIFPFINKNSLFKGQWQFKKGQMDEKIHEIMIEEQVEPLFERIKSDCLLKKLLSPSCVYGYFKCQSINRDLIIYDPENDEKIIEKFSFPINEKTNNCISFFFNDVKKEKDLIGMFCVTIGEKASLFTKELFESHQYKEYLFFHGFFVEYAEALAEYVHKMMRQELEIGHNDSPKINELFSKKYQGCRYSFGYPACPNMSDQEKLFKLLKPERIGCKLTENYQMVPEQSVSAIVTQHENARYFSA